MGSIQHYPHPGLMVKGCGRGVRRVSGLRGAMIRGAGVLRG